MIISYIGYDDEGKITSCTTNDESMMQKDADANGWKNVIKGHALPWEHYIKDGVITERPIMDVKVSAGMIVGIPIGAAVTMDGNTTIVNNGVLSISESVNSRVVRIIKFPYKDSEFGV
ncbi:hypothetical protein [Edaphovirga cremea]|uniref:hypothetical protein n=1 Tax=Edaphovirga cremea TaxID=2267246 RepID=UPI000DEEF251|nr:hypothetical protein [Edaphovirga cremea]